MAVKLEDMDLLVDEIDDATLSQVCESIESEHFVTEGLCDLSVSAILHAVSCSINEGRLHCQVTK
jgi:hypothetical protein